MALSPSPLHRVPPEILATIAASLAAARPLRPPRDLCSLRATCRHLRDALNSHHNPIVWLAAFDSRFDSAAVRRRNFRPNGRDYYDQLRQYAEVLDVLRSGDVLRPDICDTLRIVYVMLLDNDGKNRAQLEAAGIDPFLDSYIRTRLWSEAHLHEGWPQDDSTNSFALWIKWMLTTTEQLRHETTAVREEMVALVMPYVLNPYRYVQAEAPPSHFHLPLTEQGSASVTPSLPSAHGPYPVYAPDRQVSYPYFGSLPNFSPPPISVAAKLLYFARREILPFGIPPHLPATRAQAPPSNEPSPTQEDFIEVNSHKGAEPPARITWDWDISVRLVNGVPDTQPSRDHSSKWDPDYWRRRLCGNAWKRQPKWRPAKVYIPGSMDGLWQGRLVFPIQDAMHQLIQHAIYPQQTFNEISFRLTHQPMFMRLTEHHSIFPDNPIPFPPSAPSQSQENDDSSQWQDLSMKNAWLPGLPGNVNFSSSATSAYTSEEPQKTFVTIDGQRSNPWVYTDFDRKRHEEEGREHVGHESCAMCFEREQLYRKGVQLDLEDLDLINERYSTGWEDMERMFESVGLGRGETEDMDEDVDENEDDDEDVDIDDAEADDDDDDDDDDGEDEDDEGEIDFIDDPNAEVRKPFTTPVRRGTDRAKIEKCDGIRDIIFSGSTDKRHAQAWNHFTFYGRIRPWDGLIGILRRAYWPTQNLLFFYGYLTGGENFVGNWRFAAVDPNSPTWESAFVMSRRKDDDGNAQ